MTPNTPRTIDSDQDSPQEKPGQIELLNLKKDVNGWRARLKRLLHKWGPILAVSGALGGATGEYAQHKYRAATGYKTTAPEEGGAESPEKESQPEEGDLEKQQEENLKEPKSIWGKIKQGAKNRLKRADEWTRSKVDKAVERSKLMQEYRETKKELQRLWNIVLEIGDKSAFWLPFLLTFLASVKLSVKIISVKKKLSGEVEDPVTAASLKAIGIKINELVVAANAGREFSSADLAQIRRMMGEYERLTSGIGDPPPAFASKDGGGEDVVLDEDDMIKE